MTTVASLPAGLSLMASSIADADHFLGDAPWARADGWRRGGSALVAKVRDELAGIVVSATNAIHPTRDLVFVFVPERFRRQGVGTALVNAVKTRRGVPLSVKAHPGTVAHSFYKSLGAVRYQLCPPERIDASHAEVRRWASENRSEAVCAGDRFTLPQLTEAWTDMYAVVHATWSPTGPRETLLAEFGPMINEELDRSRSILVLRDGRITAACFVFGTDQDPEVEAICESIDPTSASAREDVAACMAKVLTDAGSAPVMFDGHTTDPHFYPILQDIPVVAGRPLELLEIPA
jgi:GNAT superfamily N-acetyltransferase